jgi:hypothetical protein
VTFRNAAAGGGGRCASRAERKEFASSDVASAAASSAAPSPGSGASSPCPGKTWGGVGESWSSAAVPHGAPAPSTVRTSHIVGQHTPGCAHSSARVRTATARRVHGAAGAVPFRAAAAAEARASARSDEADGTKGPRSHGSGSQPLLATSVHRRGPAAGDPAGSGLAPSAEEFPAAPTLGARPSGVSGSFSTIPEVSGSCRRFPEVSGSLSALRPVPEGIHAHRVVRAHAQGRVRGRGRGGARRKVAGSAARGRGGWR